MGGGGRRGRCPTKPLTRDPLSIISFVLMLPSPYMRGGGAKTTNPGRSAVFHMDFLTYSYTHKIGVHPTTMGCTELISNYTLHRRVIAYIT